MSYVPIPNKVRVTGAQLTLADHYVSVLENVVDNVDHPSHYNQYKGLEVIDLVEQMNFNRGNAIKYIARAGFKAPERELEDLEKARWYIDREIQRLKGE